MAARVRALVKRELLVWARETSGYTPEEAAKKLGTSADRLTAWESGEDRPTINQLRTMARVYRRPLSVFYLQEVPSGFMVMHDFRRLPGDGLRRYSPNLLFEIRAAQQRRTLALDLLEEINEEAMEFPLWTTLEADPEEVGQTIRRSLNVSYAEQIRWRQDRAGFNNWRMRVEGLGVLVFQMTRVEGDEVSGFAIAENCLPVIAVNRKNRLNRRTFSLLHEFTHVMLRLSGVSDLDVDAARPPEDQKVEVFCNQVAAAALMPRDHFLAEPIVAGHGRHAVEWVDKDIEELAYRYSVSREAVLRRLLTFGRTTQRFYMKKRALYHEEYKAHQEHEKERIKDQQFRRNSSQEALSDFGKPFVRLVLDNYYQDRITLSDVSSYLGVRLRHLPRIEERITAR